MAENRRTMGSMKRYKQKALDRYDLILRTAQPEGEKEWRLVQRLYGRNWKPHLPEDKNATFLDLGCGFGLFLRFLKSLGYTRVRGVDICEENVRICRAKGLDVVETDILSYLQDTKEVFDVITLNHVLEHYEKEPALSLLEGVRERLKPNGLLLAAVPNMASPVVGLRCRYMDITHETGFTQESLTELITLAGFRECKILPIDIYVLPNPLVNIPGKLLGIILMKFFRLLFLVFGVRSTNIFTKHILAVAKK